MVRSFVRSLVIPLVIHTDKLAAATIAGADVCSRPRTTESPAAKLVKVGAIHRTFAPCPDFSSAVTIPGGASWNVRLTCLWVRPQWRHRDISMAVT